MTDDVCITPGCVKCGRDKSPSFSRTVGQVNGELTITKKDGNDLLIRIKHSPHAEVETLQERLSAASAQREQYRIKARELEEELQKLKEELSRRKNQSDLLRATIHKLAEIA